MWLGIWLAVLGGQNSLSAAEDVATIKGYADSVYAATRQRYTTNQLDPVIAWEFARACFDRAEFSTSDNERAGYAKSAIAACRQAIDRNPKNAALLYYLGMNLGQLAQTKSIGALKLVKEMEELFIATRELDPKLDNGGPDRNLGLLYLQAPGWPASIGNKTKAREHLDRAVELFPDFPENRMCLLEAFIKWDDTQNIRFQYKLLARRLPVAREELTGKDWAAAWRDWNHRWQIIQRKVGSGTPSTE